MEPIKLDPERYYMVKLRSELMLMRGDHAQELREVIAFAQRLVPVGKETGVFSMSGHYRLAFFEAEECDA